MDDVTETENELIMLAQNAMSGCNWTVGECAAKWCARYARGRTDADFGSLVGLSGDQIYARRRIWEAVGVSGLNRKLKWSHFYVSLAWDDSAMCLDWAEENAATVAEMKAWRRMQRGDDLTVDAEPEPEAAVGFGEPVIRPRQDTSATLAGELDPLTEPSRDPHETAQTTTGAVSPAYSTARSDEAKQQREPTANQRDEVARVKRCLARMSTAARELAKIGSGRWFDLLRDHLDQLAEDARQNEEPNGLDKQTIDAVIKGVHS